MCGGNLVRSVAFCCYGRRMKDTICIAAAYTGVTDPSKQLRKKISSTVRALDFLHTCLYSNQQQSLAFVILGSFRGHEKFSLPI